MGYRNRFSRQSTRRYLLLVLGLLTIVGASLLGRADRSSAVGQGAAQPPSPSAPRHKSSREDADTGSNISWIQPSGGSVQSENCGGIQITLPPGFYDRRVNAHCNLAKDLYAPPTGWSEVGSPFYLGVWSGSGEVSQFLVPIVVRIPVAQDELGTVPAGKDIDFNLCLWNEGKTGWSCVPAYLVADGQSVSAAFDTLQPTHAIKGWEGNSYVSLVRKAANGSSAVAATKDKTAAAKQPVVVYENDFESSKADGWTVPWISDSPSGRRFLGRFANESVQLQLLSKLPDHQRVRLEFDLYIIGTWDGNRTDYDLGPDRWKVAVVDGETLLDTSFGNGNPARSPYTQSYPGWYPDDQYPKRTGAVENNTLGFSDVSNNTPVQDAVYHLAFEFGHTGPDLKVEFAGLGLQGIGDESWGIDNIQVQALPK